MVKLDDVPIEEGRIPLDQLADFMDANGGRIILITTSQEMVDEDKTAKKTGGLKANLWTGRNYKSKYSINEKKLLAIPITYEDGLQLTQKWGKIPSVDLVKNLEKMGFNDTDALGEAFFEYKLVSQRTGFPRLLPIGKSDKPVEEFDLEEKKSTKKK